MAVAAIGATGVTGNAQAAQKGTTVDYQSFLKLLVAQMKNQDPTAPMDSTDYVAQLATFSQVEQTVQTNSKLDQILQAQALSQASSLIGRTMTSNDGTVSGTVTEVKLYSDGVIAVLDDGRQVPMLPGVKRQLIQIHERGRRARNRPVRYLDRAGRVCPGGYRRHDRRHRHRACPGADADPGNHADLRAEDRRHSAGDGRSPDPLSALRYPHFPASSSSASKRASDPFPQAARSRQVRASLSG
jgi:flagellar basal-body rod modification protein FlgD